MTGATLRGIRGGLGGLVAAVGLFSLGCGGGGGGGTPPPRADAGPPDTGQPDGGVDAGPLDAGAPDTGPPEPTAVRFFVLGDTGEGNEDQYAVADVMEGLCASDGCDFAVLLGDNIYDDGVSGVDDPQWQTKFEMPYADLAIPFYVVLGNHDYGGEVAFIDTPGVGNEWDKGPIAVMYTELSDRWVLPDTHYTFTWGNVGFVMLDTNSVLWDDTTHGDQRDWYATAMMEVSGADWVFAAGHHPYLSNGRHGNAGSYESIEVGGTDIPLPVPILDGRNVKSFFEEVVCGTVDIYFAGHDHNRQWLDEAASCGGTELVVSGAGAKTTGFVNTERNAAHFQDDSIEGLMYVVAEGNILTTRFYDKTGAMSYERVLMR